MRTAETAGMNSEAPVVQESGQSLRACRVRTRPCLGMRLGPGVEEPGVGASSPGGRGPLERRPSPPPPLPGTPGPPPAPAARLSPGVSADRSPQKAHPARPAEALPEAPGPEARVGGCGAPCDARSRCSAPGRVSGFFAVVPSLAEQDPEEQQDRGREAHPDEILHRVVWGEGAQVSAGPSPGTGVCAQGTRLPGEDVAPSPAPDGDAVLLLTLGLTAVMGEGVGGPRVLKGGCGWAVSSSGSLPGPLCLTVSDVPAQDSELTELRQHRVGPAPERWSAGSRGGTQPWLPGTHHRPQQALAQPSTLPA